MLFNSYEFILLFLPATLLVFFALSHFTSWRWAIAALTAASLFFYGWWNPPYLGLLLLSLGVNYGLAWTLGQSQSESHRNKALLILGLMFNIGLLVYYKYTNFFVDNINHIFDTSFHISTIILPLGISFYTFQQIAYLIDASEGETKEHRFLDYCLFVTFFPQLIAGPIVNHQEMVPQFSQRPYQQKWSKNLSVGLAIFGIGLFKKVVLADQIALYASPVFEAASQGTNLTLFEAWGGALAYNLQIYFDFSGYSDMAIGAARLFGFILPLNFNSPYKATSIIEFWQRWHMTLTRFLTRYLYNPIAITISRRRLQAGKSGIKRGVASPTAFLQIVAFPTLFTMFISGFWHGAGWQYIVFGLLHGLYLVINHGWIMMRKAMGHRNSEPHWWSQLIGWVLTFMGVLVAHVFFRAKDVSTAGSLLKAMVSIHELSWSNGGLFPNRVFGTPVIGLSLITLMLAIALFLPNTQEWMANYNPALDYKHTSDLAPERRTWTSLWHRLRWRPNRAWAIVTSILLLSGLLSLSNVSEFIYFQF